MNRKNILLIGILICLILVNIWVYSCKLSPKHQRQRLRQQDKYFKNLPIINAELFVAKLEYLEYYYGIHCLMAGVDSLKNENIESLAQRLFKEWNVGINTGKGVLILFTKKEKVVKLEVGYELEDIYTDAYCSYLEREVFSPYLQKGKIDLAFWSILEQILHKAEKAVRTGQLEPLKKDEYLTEDHLSGGAGVKRDISKEKYSEGIFLSEEEKRRFKAQPTPEATFELYKEAIDKKIRNADLGIYSEKSIMTNKQWPETITWGQSKDYKEVLRYPYVIKSSSTRAVVLLRTETGTDRFGPFFILRTSKGWQMDLPSIRLLVWHDNSRRYHFHYSNNPYWKILNGEADFEDDEIENEENIAERITILKDNIFNNNNALESCKQLGELYFSATLFDDAIYYYKQALKINEKDHDSLWNIAAIRDEENYYNSAIEAYKKYMYYYPGNKEYAIQKIAWNYFYINDFKNSIKYFKKLLNSSRREFLLSGYQGLAINYADLGNISKAEYYYNLALKKMDPQKLISLKNYIDAAKSRYRKK